MTKHCINCGELHEKRGDFCKPECHKDHRIKKRNDRANKYCRLCGRPGNPEEWARYRRWRKWEREQEALLRSAHTPIQESGPCQI